LLRDFEHLNGDIFTDVPVADAVEFNVTEIASIDFADGDVFFLDFT
jgi:hypothetical protein